MVLLRLSCPLGLCGGVGVRGRTDPCIRLLVTVRSDILGLDLVSRDRRSWTCHEVGDGYYSQESGPVD